MLIDYSSQVHYFWAMLPEVVLAIWAILVLMVDVFQKGDRQQLSAPAIRWLSLAGVGAAIIANFWLLRLTPADSAGMMAIDGFRVYANTIFLVAAGLFLLISDRYFTQERIHVGELNVLVLLATVGMMVFAGANNLMLVFVGLELMAVPVYVLAGVHRRDRRSAEAALKYFLLGAFSSAFFLFGVALTYGGAGTVNISEVAGVIGADGIGSNPLMLAGMVLILVGFAFKVAAVPFHMWAPDVYTGAPAPVAALMATALKAAAFAAFIRVFLTAFPGFHEAWGVLVFWLAIFSMVFANLVALAQHNVKRMLAYSSLAHVGYLLVAFSAFSTLGTASFLFYLTVYTFMTVGAFSVVFIIAGAGEERLDLESYSGLAKTRPLLAAAMTVYLLSLAGFPLTGGFIGKVFILRASLEAGLLSLAILLVMASLVSYWYYLRVAWFMWFREADGEGVFDGIVLVPSIRVALVSTAVLLLVLGVFPGFLLEVAERSAAVFAATTSSIPVLGAR